MTMRMLTSGDDDDAMPAANGRINDSERSTYQNDLAFVGR